MQGTDSQARDDWRSEVNQMGRVYSSAHITISAAAARDSDGGLFSRGRCLLPCLGKYGVVAVYWLTRERNLGGEPIYKRAWTAGAPTLPEDPHVRGTRPSLAMRQGDNWEHGQPSKTLQHGTAIQTSFASRNS